MSWNAGEWFEWELPESTWWDKKNRKFPCLRSAAPNVVIVKFADADEWEQATYSITAYPSGGAIVGSLIASDFGLDGCRKFCGILSGLCVDWSKEPKEIFRDVSLLDDAQFEVFACVMKGEKLTDVELAEFRKAQVEKVSNFANYQAQQDRRRRYVRGAEKPAPSPNDGANHDAAHAEVGAKKRVGGAE